MRRIWKDCYSRNERTSGACSTGHTKKARKKGLRSLKTCPAEESSIRSEACCDLVRPRVPALIIKIQDLTLPVRSSTDGDGALCRNDCSTARRLYGGAG